MRYFHACLITKGIQSLQGQRITHVKYGGMLYYIRNDSFPLKYVKYSV